MNNKEKIRFAINQISITNCDGSANEDAIKAVRYLQEVSHSLYTSDIVNFCTMSNDELMAILDLCGLMNIVTNSDMTEKIRGGVCIEKKWEWYDTIVVTPIEIRYTKSPYPPSVIMTSERYDKIRKM